MVVKDINTGESYLFECFEKGEWREVSEEHVQVFMEGSNMGVSQEGSYVSDANGRRFMSLVLNTEAGMEWLIYHLEQAALATCIPLLVQCVVRQIADACMNAQDSEEEEEMLDLILRLQAIGEKYHLSIPPFPQTRGPADEQQS
ncbi:MAG: hypothetical protein J6X49_18775 [Victivallales bacterium]|nr:hypothetical protein [Victivallales bacterium]